MASRSSLALILAACIANVGHTAAVEESAKFVRSEKALAVEIDEHSHLMHAATADDDANPNPCSHVGCNSHKCTWTTGDVVRKVVEKKSCKNARELGTMADETNKIETLTDCLKAVKSQLVKGTDDKGEKCSPTFELHKDSYRCACVPASTKCEESDDEKVCRLELVSWKPE